MSRRWVGTWADDLLVVGTDLQRFLDAQDQDGTYVQALRELRAGHKRTHWMWFVFPQLAGLGRSATAERYALPGGEAARAYLDHPVLGGRLLESCTALVEADRIDPVEVLGATDAVKLRSSLTLFTSVAPEHDEFAEVLDQYYDGRRCELTLRMLSTSVR